MTTTAFEIIRKKFIIRLHKWQDCADKATWVLRQEVATSSEKAYAEKWLRANGWNEQQIEAARGLS